MNTTIRSSEKIRPLISTLPYYTIPKTAVHKDQPCHTYKLAQKKTSVIHIQSISTGLSMVLVNLDFIVVLDLVRGLFLTGNFFLDVKPNLDLFGGPGQISWLGNGSISSC